MIDADRALRAFTDVLAVEYDPETEMARVVTMSDCYDVDMRETRHVCPDREYNLDGTGICKHLLASEVVRGQLDVPGGWLVVDSLDKRTDEPFDIEMPPRIGNDRTLEAFTDGGDRTDELQIYGVDGDGRPRVERKRVSEGQSHTEARYDTLPSEFAALVDGPRAAVADLPDDVQDWIDSESSGELVTDGGHNTMQDNIRTDGGEVQTANRPAGHDQWTLWNAERENARHFDDRADAEDKRDELSGLMDVELFQPGESPEALFHADGNPETDTEPKDVTDDTAGPVEDCDVCGDAVPIREAEAGDGGKPIHPDCEYADDSDDVDHVAESVEQAATQEADAVDHAPPAADAPDPALEPDAAHDTEVLSPDEVEQYAADLDDRDVGTDPLKWMPGEFVDEIDGTQAINRRGFEVLAHFYNVEVRTDIQVPPEDTGHEYCRVEATAVTADGREVNAHGSAHVDRGDDSYLLLEMAETRARKRSLSIATGSGAVAVSELQNEVQ